MMDFGKLAHLVRMAQALAPQQRIVLFGSMCVLVKYPGIAEETALYQITYDADFIPEPWDDDLGKFMNDTMGKESDFRDRYTYYADIVRPAAFEQFPPGFQDRLVPIDGFQNAYALEIHDMAVAKLWAGRPKDIALLGALLHLGKIDQDTMAKRLWDTPMEEKWIVKTHQVLDHVIAEAKRLTDAGVSAQELRLPSP